MAKSPTPPYDEPLVELNEARKEVASHELWRERPAVIMVLRRPG